jgi:hypothetical protein
MPVVVAVILTICLLIMLQEEQAEVDVEEVGTLLTLQEALRLQQGALILGAVVVVTLLAQV